jgi:glycosyltransferase involved in cell wall biosynthesis
MSETPAVSVIIPTYDRVEALARAIDSVLAQTFASFEVVVVDDGPNDSIASFVSEHPDPRVRLVRHEQNRGVAAARNTGIASARADVLGFLDDDDLWLPTKLERQLAAHEDPNVKIVHTLAYVCDANGVVYDAPSERGFRLFREVAEAGYPYDLLLRRSSFFFGTFLVRRSCFDIVGGFDDSLPTVDDLDLVHRLRREFDFHLVDEPLVKYCIHLQSQGQSKDPRMWERLARKELDWLSTSDVPERRAAAAYLQRQLALAAWIGGRYRAGVRPTVRARRLDRSVIPPKTAAKYLAAGVLPKRLVDVARERTREVRARQEPDPWLDL